MIQVILLAFFMPYDVSSLHTKPPNAKSIFVCTQIRTSFRCFYFKSDSIAVTISLRVNPEAKMWKPTF